MKEGKGLHYSALGWVLPGYAVLRADRMDMRHGGQGAGSRAARVGYGLS